MTLAELSLDHFAPYTGQPFTLIDAEGNRFSVILAEATARQTVEFPGRMREPFQIQFKSAEHSARGFLRQALYTVVHEALEPVAIFLVPIGPPADGSGGFLYQAVFS